MNTNLEETCGKKQISGGSGLKGMSIKQIEDLIDSLVTSSSNSNLESNFKRTKSIKLKKGESKRLRYCSFLKDKFPSEWEKYSKGKQPVVSVTETISKFLNEESGSENENAVVNENNNSGEVNYGNEEPLIADVYIPTIRNRRKERDPLSGSLSRGLRKKISKSVSGEAPKFSTLEQMAKSVLAVDPKSIAPRKRNAPPTVPFKFMNFPRDPTNVLTMRRPTQPSKPVIRTTQLTPTDIRKAGEFANRITKSIQNAGITSNLQSALVQRFTKSNANKILNDLSQLETFSFNKVRDIIRSYELTRTEAIKSLNEPQPPKESKMGFNAILQMSVPSELKTKTRQRLEQVMKKLTLQREKRERGPKSKINKANILNNSEQPRYTPKLLQQQQNVNSNSNTNTNVNVPKKTRRPLLGRKVKIIGSKTYVKNVNVDTMNKPQLLNAAVMLASELMPGKEVNFSSATNDKLRSVVKAAAKKYNVTKQ